MGHDAEYVKGIVGEVLSKGLAQTLIAAPEDPVDYLGRWLLQYVATQVKTTRVGLERRQANAQRRAEEVRSSMISDLARVDLVQERIREAKCKVREAAQAKERALEEVAQSVDSGGVTDLYELWSGVANVVTKWTAIQAAYVAVVLPEVEPEDGPSEKETEEILEDEGPLFDVEEEEEAQEAQEEKEEEVEQEVEDDFQEVQEMKRFFEFVAAANADQKFLLHKQIHK